MRRGTRKRTEDESMVPARIARSITLTFRFSKAEVVELLRKEAKRRADENRDMGAFFPERLEDSEVDFDLDYEPTAVVGAHVTVNMSEDVA